MFPALTQSLKGNDFGATAFARFATIETGWLAKP